MNMRFASLFLVCVACSGSIPSSSLTSVDSSVPVSQDAGDDVEVESSSTSVSSTTSSASSTSSTTLASSSTTSSVSSSVSSSSVSSSVTTSASSSHSGSDAGTVEKVPCAGPNGCYSYVFTTSVVNGVPASDTCGFLEGNGLNSQSAFTTIGNNLESAAPSFCATDGDVPMTTSTISTNFCNASATSTCSDPTTATGATTYVAVSVLTANTDGSIITGTLTLTESNEDGPGSCSENLTFTATKYADILSSGVCPAVM